ncbi:MAG TPA: substrate-binding domain-containing protein [Thermoanaerobaculia bacterium]|nr:substrate-binding domain-containing protein [Thermoanaerobaculia bacterium]
MRAIVTCITWLVLAVPAAAERSFVLATTTSIENSGLLRELITAFEKSHGIEIRVVSAGSGKALRLGEVGDADVLLTHDPEAEARFVRASRPLLYRQFTYNEFVIVGPRDDPASIRGSRSAVEAFRRIARANAPFAARNDSSGTATREMAVWRAAGIDPRRNRRYRPLGQPMAALLRAASELRAYALTDSATFERLASRLDLSLLFRGDPMLRNIYAVTLIRTDGWRPSREHGAQFVKWLLSPAGRRVVESFRINNRQQFYWLPAAPGGSHRSSSSVEK